MAAPHFYMALEFGLKRMKTVSNLSSGNEIQLSKAVPN
jgi:hypothetical protein